MQVDPATLSPKDSYLLMISCVIPRPIGWASTLAPDGTPNLAPFSYFGGVSSSPMTVMLSVGRRGGEPKDTGANLLATKEAVIHIAHRPLAEAISSIAERPVTAIGRRISPVSSICARAESTAPSSR